MSIGALASGPTFVAETAIRREADAPKLRDLPVRRDQQVDARQAVDPRPQFVQEGARAEAARARRAERREGEGDPRGPPGEGDGGGEVDDEDPRDVRGRRYRGRGFATLLAGADTSAERATLEYARSGRPRDAARDGDLYDRVG